MNQQSVLNLLPAISGNPLQRVFGGATKGAAPVPNLLASGLFNAQLQARLNAIVAKNALVPSGSTQAASGMSSTTSPIQALAKKISDQLNAGVSLGDITTQLAASLATSVAAQLGVSGDAARRQLQTVFASALAPPGQTGPPSQSTADQAITLAQRFAHIASTATRVAANGESGQLNRFVGNILDANSAKETPAQASTVTTNAGNNALGVVSQALLETAASKAPVSMSAARNNALGVVSQALIGSAASKAPASMSAARSPSVSDAALQNALALAQAQLTAPLTTNPVTIAASAASDGKTVLAQSKAISTGGDTLLGRVLTRAANVASSNQPVPAPSANASDAAPAATQLVPRTVTDPTLASFLKSFTSAFATRAGSGGLLKSAATDGTANALLAPTVSPTNDAMAFVPSVAPLAIDTSNHVATNALPLPAHPVPDASQSAIIDQILHGAFMKNLGQSSEIRLSLVPENLGDVSVKLTVNSGGTVDAHVIAQTTDVRDALVAGQSQLTRSLADAGLKLTSFNVDVNSGGFAGFTQQQNSSSQQRSSEGRRTLIAGIESDESGDESTLLAAPSFGPPLVAGQNLGALNYLV